MYPAIIIFMVFFVHPIVIIFIPELEKFKKMEKKVLHEIIREDIERPSDMPETDLHLRLLRHYYGHEITPKLLQYIDDNYMKEFPKVNARIERDNQKKREEEKKQRELQAKIESVQKRQTARVNAFRTVKELPEK